jgi:hypothetical protein
MTKNGQKWHFLGLGFPSMGTSLDFRDPKKGLFSRFLTLFVDFFKFFIF